jgi:phosphatidate cytidylyltransferase
MADSGALLWRLTIGPILIVLLVGLFYADARTGDSALCLLALALCATLRSVYEYVELLRARKLVVSAWLLALCSSAIVAGNWLADWFGPTANDGFGLYRLGSSALFLGIAVIVLFIAALLRYQSPGGNLERLGIEILCLSYLGVLLSATVQLRWIARPSLCYLPLASVVIVTKCGDTAAYFTGRALGRAKLCPLISPGKTRAGAWGALAGAALGSWLCLSVAPAWFADVPPAAWYWSVVYGLVLGVAGILGDLAESLIKRDMGRKDSAPLLPGFGGILDLLDSVLFAGPVAYLLWCVLPLPK